jgi:predicted  nucleic acid-binding Zn-ribbon protein
VSELKNNVEKIKTVAGLKEKIGSIEDARATLAAFMDTEQDRLQREIDRLKARNAKLECVLENTKAYIKGIKPPLGHDRHRLWLTLTAAIALTESEAARSGE